MATYWLVSLPLLNDSAEETWRAVVEKCGGATGGGGGEASSSRSHHRHYHRQRSSASAAAPAATATPLADLTKFSLPELRVGTLDALLGLSDDLVRVNAAVEGVTNKLRRQLLELSSTRAEGGAGGGAGTLLGGGTDGDSSSSAPSSSSSATVDGAAPESYLERFSWDAAKHPPRRPLGETAAAIAETAAKLEGDLKARAGEVAALRSSLAAANRKASGSLAVRDLCPLLAKAPRGRLVDTENLATLAVVVPRGAERDWLASYETLTDFVVPRSGGNSGPVAEDGDYVLHTVVLFRRVADAYRAAARSRGFQVRDVDVAATLAAGGSGTAATNGGSGAAASAAAAAPSASSSANATASAAALRDELEAKRTALERWARAAYGAFSLFFFHLFFLCLFFFFFRVRGHATEKLTLFSSNPPPLPNNKITGEAFSCWIHVCAIRLFAESVLRYGLPPRLLPLLVRPAPKAAPRLRKALDGMFGSARTSKFFEADPSSGAGGGGGGGGDGEMYPYVSFTLSLDS